MHSLFHRFLLVFFLFVTFTSFQEGVAMEQEKPNSPKSPISKSFEFKLMNAIQRRDVKGVQEILTEFKKTFPESSLKEFLNKRPSTENFSNSTYLTVATLGRNTAIMEALLGEGADINQKDISTFESLGEGPIHIALRAEPTTGENRAPRASLKALQFLIKAGANLETETTRGNQTALNRAVLQNDIPIAKVLLEAGANPNHPFTTKAPNTHKDTPLGVAIRKHHNLKMVQLLLDYKADPNLMTRGGPGQITPLRAAVLEEQIPIMERLIKAGASLNPLDCVFKFITRGEERNIPILKHASFEAFQTLIEAGISYAGLIAPQDFEEDNKKTLLRKEVLSQVLYPEKSKLEGIISPYTFLTVNNKKLSDLTDPVLVRTAAAQSLRVLMGQSAAYEMGEEYATPDKVQLTILAIRRVAHVGNDLALLNFLNSGNEDASEKFKKHKLVVYMAYQREKKEAFDLKHLERLGLGLDEKQLGHYSAIFSKRYEQYFDLPLTIGGDVS